MSSSSSWRVKSSWLNSQSSRVVSSWKYKQLDLNWVENVSNSTRCWFKFKMSTWNSTQWSVYICNIKWCNRSFQTVHINIFDMSLTCFRSLVDSSLLRSRSLWWATSKFSHFQLLSWVRLFLESLDFHEVLHYLLSVF